MKFVTVLSHHKSAGGQPLDSFWFSGQACQCNGLKLTFLWTRRLRDLWGILHAHRVVFDGVPSLVEGHGLKFYLLARLLKLSLAIYWHKTDWGIEKARNRQPRYYPTVCKAMESPNVTHFHVCRYGLRLLESSYRVSKDALCLLNNISVPDLLLAYELPLDFEPGYFVGCGLAVPRKGIDLFLQIAEHAVANGVPAHFVWMGPFCNDVLSPADLEQQLADKGLTHRVSFMGYCTDPAAIIARANGLLLTSRDNPMPKVLQHYADTLGHCWKAASTPLRKRSNSSHRCFIPFLSHFPPMLNLV